MVLGGWDGNVGRRTHGAAVTGINGQELASAAKGPECGRSFVHGRVHGMWEVQHVGQRLLMSRGVANSRIIPVPGCRPTGCRRNGVRSHALPSPFFCLVFISDVFKLLITIRIERNLIPLVKN